MPTKRSSAAETQPQNEVLEAQQEAVPTVVGEVVDGCENAPSLRARGEDKPWLWKPGQSPNPGGRKKVDPVVKALVIDKSLAAAQTLVSLMEDPKVSPRIRCEAAQAILDRAYGKPTQPIDANIEGEFKQMVVVFQGELEKYAK